MSIETIEYRVGKHVLNGREVKIISSEKLALLDNASRWYYGEGNTIEAQLDDAEAKLAREEYAALGKNG